MLAFILAATLAATVRPQFILTTEWLGNNLYHPDVRVLDIGNVTDYKTAHIPGAVLIPKAQLIVNRNGLRDELPPVAKLEQLFRRAGIRDTDRIVITSNDPLLATRAWFTLDALGYGDHASILDGGNAKWFAEHREISQMPARVKESTFVAHVDNGAVITRDGLKRLLELDPTLVVIDARPPREFMGKAKGWGIENAGHIPKAECLPWQSNTQIENGARVFRTTRELADMYASLNVSMSHQRVVVYCRTGVEASMTYFVLRYLGYYPSLYDGAYDEWNKTEVASVQ